MKKLASLSGIEWIAEGMKPKASGDRYAVAHCVPPVFPAYAKLFHPIYEDASVKDLELTWQEADVQARSVVAGPFKTPTEEILHEALRGATLVYGGAEPGGKLSQIRWAELARRVGVPLAPTLNDRSFTRRFPEGSWPRRLIGPEEGNLADAERDALASVLQRHTMAGCCFFHLWVLATTDWGGGDLLFEGLLNEAPLFPADVEGAHFTPTHWFPEGREWLVHTDYDSTFTLVGGSEALIGDLLQSPVLERMAIEPETRVGWDADLEWRHDLKTKPRHAQYFIIAKRGQAGRTMARQGYAASPWIRSTLT